MSTCKQREKHKNRKPKEFISGSLFQKIILVFLLIMELKARNTGT